MLNHISIRDFAIIENIELDIAPGLNVITGETGAGKSILIEAVSLALGARADTAFVRSGADKAIVQLAGELDGEEIVITREVTQAGKNLCKLNGNIVTLSELNKYCGRLADIHGQYDHQSLLDPDCHIDLVDLYGIDAIAPVKNSVSGLCASYRSTKSALSSLISGAAENARKRDFMAFELSEIKGASLREGEDTELEERIALLSNSEKIYEALAGAHAAAKEGTGSADDSLSEISSRLADAAPYTDDLKELSEEFNDLYYRMQDLFSEMRRQRDNVTFSQEELDEAIARLDEIGKLKRKYGGSIADILAYADETEQKLKIIDNTDDEKAVLESELRMYGDQLRLASERLSTLRRSAAKELEAKISSELAELNFTSSTVEISFTKLDDFTENGIDKVEFLISANAGEPLKPLAKIASGGEMSRIMLAFKKIIADYDNIPTLIFDEIDTGISGITASIVGKKLREIADGHQIICITHLPQIAACGSQNYLIRKNESGGRTRTEVLPLTHAEKIAEIARLLGGTNITETTMRSAEELVNACEN